MELGCADLEDAVLRLFAMVEHGIVDATASFLEGDRETARRIVADDALIDDLQLRIERLVQTELDRPVTAHADMRLFVSVLRVVPELERTGDLVEHIALRSQHGLARGLTPMARRLIGEMGSIAAEMWGLAAGAWRARSTAALPHLRALDDRLDDLHVRLTEDVARNPVPVAAAIELGLVARFFERLGDHAVNVTRRIEYLVATGVAPVPQ